MSTPPPDILRALATTFLLFLPTVAVAQDSKAASGPSGKPQVEVARTAEEEVIAAVRNRLAAAARNDIKEWARYVADDSLAPLEGTLGSKQSWIKAHEHWPSAVKYYYGSLEDIKVRIHGDTAVIAYRAKQYNDIGGQITYQQTWQIETLMRRGKEWLQVAVADAPIALVPAVAKVDPALYDEYVGQYEWAPTLIASIAREGDRLFMTMTGQEKEELLPENVTTFFFKPSGVDGGSSRVIFVRGENGKITHYVFRDFGSTDRIVKKIR